MNLKVRAIRAARERYEQIEIEKLKAADQFAQKAIKEFRAVFGDVEDLTVKEMDRDECEIIADGLKFWAQKKGSEYCIYIKFYMHVRCRKCGKWFTHPVQNLADVGDLLSRPPMCEDCQMLAKYGTTEVKSEAERVMEMLREIIEIVSD
ncbi:MAG: hypothetical protein DRP85_06545 [Candidatus Makaraimicrobium thalassicum]|nr:MAG: hypothetical protein DRP85_06545 [Candidatus Omnitrophota bacterium]